MRDEVIRAYRTKHPGLDAVQLEVLRLLQIDDRMEEIWDGFDQRALYALAVIMSCHGRAEMTGDKPEMFRELSEKFRKLTAAKELLRGHFSAFLEEADPNPPANIVERRVQMDAAIASLDWMQSWLSEEENTHRYFLQHFSPMSQKKNNQENAFSVMLCNEFTEAFGQPYYARVATITDVIYSTDEAISVQALEKRVERDREARTQAGLQPWLSSDDWFDD